MKLVVAGDSNSFGSETVKDLDIFNLKSPLNAYGYFLSKFLKFKYVNLALPGASNTDIAFQIINYLKNNNFKDTLFIVGWTESTRQKNKNNVFINHDILFTYKKLSKNKELLKDMSKELSLDNIYYPYKKIDPTLSISNFLLNEIFTTDEYHKRDMMNMVAIERLFIDKKIPYFMFPTSARFFFKSYFDITDIMDSKRNVFYFKKNKIFFNIKNMLGKNLPEVLNLLDLKIPLFTYGVSINFHFHEVFKKYGLAKGRHPTTNAHKKIAEWLLHEINNRDILPGQMAERFKAAVLKTVDAKASVGSNPTLSVH